MLEIKAFKGTLLFILGIFTITFYFWWVAQVGFLESFDHLCEFFALIKGLSLSFKDSKIDFLCRVFYNLVSSRCTGEYLNIVFWPRLLNTVYLISKITDTCHLFLEMNYVCPVTTSLIVKLLSKLLEHLSLPFKQKLAYAIKQLVNFLLLILWLLLKLNDHWF